MARRRTSLIAGFGTEPFDQKDRFDLDGNATRKRRCPNCGSRVLTGGSQNLNEQIGTPIYDCRVIGKVRRRVHKAEHFDDAQDKIEPPESLPGKRQEIEADLASMQVGGLDIQVRSDHAG